jgi:hypothetical protein
VAKKERTREAGKFAKVKEMEIGQSRDKGS